MSVNHSQPLIGHLVELRNRLLRSVVAILVAFLCLVYFSSDIYSFVAQPLLDVLPEGGAMIATDVAAPFFTPIKLTIVVAIFATVPYWLSQVWAFIVPGLYHNERRMLVPLIFGSALLFYLGAFFAYYVVFPLAFAFFTSVAPDSVSIATDISSYLNFVLKLFFAFGLAFQIPIATLLLCWTSVSTPKSLASKRSHVIVGVFVVGMLLTPPDIISQTLLALPMWILFETGLAIARLYEPNDSKSTCSTQLAIDKTHH